MIALEKLGNISVESLVQQGIDTILNRDSKPDNQQKKIILVKRSLDQNGNLYKLPSSHDFTLVAYQIRHKRGQGSILVTLDHLRKFKRNLNRQILDNIAKGNLHKADRYIHKQNNVDSSHYTHRIKVYRVTQNRAKILSWIIDFDFYKESSDEKSYGSGTAKALLKSLLESFLDHKVAKSREYHHDYLDSILELNWAEEVEKAAKPFYRHNRITHKLIFSKASSS